jgi:hypothetical protein
MTEALRRTLLALTVVASVSGCDPTAGVYIRQPLVPATTAECIGAALRESPLVASVSFFKGEFRQAYEIEVRDTTLKTGHRRGMVEIDSSSTAQTLATIGVVRRGEMTWTMSDEFSRHLSTLGVGIAAHLRASCAPGSPTVVGCRIEGFGPSRDCPDRVSSDNPAP